MSKPKPILSEADIELILRRFQHVFPTKDELENTVRRIVKEEVGLLPTSEEFHTAMDQLMGEVKSEREENEIQQAKLSDHEDRLDHIESHLHLTT